MKPNNNNDYNMVPNHISSAAEQTVQTLNNLFCVEMGKPKPKIMKNLNSLYNVFVPVV